MRYYCHLRDAQCIDRQILAGDLPVKRLLSEKCFREFCEMPDVCNFKRRRQIQSRADIAYKLDRRHSNVAQRLSSPGNSQTLVENNLRID